ncbi:SDR family oxidoreductase [uncultured Roseibium sp.]|uniref:SDR family oxidoreductase n=1 Tax=uncultured Roseibium sp. TaxID=1936171 RepID=UPI0026169281|nr:SDR family oxidoreductase [uncultured Roseibium sp.]
MNKKAVVLGAYGFIGSACVRALEKKGFSVCGVGRSSKLANAEFPDIEWSIRNIAQTSIGDWKQLLADADVVVNASGTLQDGARDNLKAIHETAVSNICDALAGTRTKLIQISAAGVTEDALTDFFRTKARGDAIIMSSDIEWIVLRPVLVLGSQAYGGTALLRAAAAFPAVQGMIMPEAKVQTIHVGDLAGAVAEAAEGRLGTRFVADLTETGSQTFSELTEKLRAWLGFPAWRFRVKVPAWSLKLLGRCADALGWLGWRSPLRTNALRSLEAGITGDPDTWKSLDGAPLKSLRETLDEMPATAQERMFSRLYLALPLAIGCLSLFWLLSGMFGLVSFSKATAVLTDQGVSVSIAAAAVVSGSILDLGLGLAVLFRRWTRLACLGMIALSAVYLAAGTILTPHLWLDPLGVFVKVLPGMALALLVALVLEER